MHARSTHPPQGKAWHACGDEPVADQVVQVAVVAQGLGALQLQLQGKFLLNSTYRYRGGARAPGGQQLPAGRVHHAHQHGQRGLRRLLHQQLQLGRVRERAQVVLDGAAEGAGQLRRRRRRRPPQALLRQRHVRARPLHLLGGGQHGAAVGQDALPRRPLRRRQEQDRRPAHPLQGHYDVNNEMLHGSFYQDKLGKDIRATMFKTASELDPDALLFVNDYNVEGMCDIRATPEAYIEQIIGLQEQGAPVSGVGLQGHVSNPVGPVIRNVLDRLAVLGLPLWFTELDVSAANEYVRAEDLEVMLREAYAHPAVEGVMLWGFWELFMSRDSAHLVNAEGEINEAGRRLLQLKKEWLTHAHGQADENGEFKFRGHHGTYHVDVVTPTGCKITQEFTVDKDDSPMVLSINV